MAETKQGLGPLNFEAGADLTSSRGIAVKFSSGKLIAAAAATDICFGVITEGAANGERASVMPFTGADGAVRVKLAASPGSVVAGSYLQIDSAGKFVIDAGSGARVRCAIANEAGAANEEISAHLFRPESLS